MVNTIKGEKKKIVQVSCFVPVEKAEFLKRRAESENRTVSNFIYTKLFFDVSPEHSLQCEREQRENKRFREEQGL